MLWPAVSKLSNAHRKESYSRETCLNTRWRQTTFTTHILWSSWHEFNGYKVPYSHYDFEGLSETCSFRGQHFVRAVSSLPRCLSQPSQESGTLSTAGSIGGSRLYLTGMLSAYNGFVCSCYMLLAISNPPLSTPRCLITKIAPKLALAKTNQSSQN